MANENSKEINLNKEIPEEVSESLKTLEKAEFNAYLVGGCVRDLLLNKTPKDWDITTNAKPEELLKLFPDPKFHSIYKNNLEL